MIDFWKAFKIDQHLPFQTSSEKIPLRRVIKSGQGQGYSFVIEFDEMDVACTQKTNGYLVSVQQT